MTGITGEPSFEEADINEGRVEIAELEDEDFESEIVLVFRLSSMHLPVVEHRRQGVVDAAQDLCG